VKLRNLCIIQVETPESIWGKDKDGLWSTSYLFRPIFRWLNAKVNSETIRLTMYGSDFFAVKINGKESFLGRNGKTPDKITGMMKLKIVYNYSSTGEDALPFEFEDSRGFTLKYSSLIINGKRIVSTKPKSLSGYDCVMSVTKRSGNYQESINFSVVTQ
jgi:hypothetical protein